MTTWMTRSRATLFSLGFAVSITACGQAQVEDVPIVSDLAAISDSSERAYFTQLLETPFVGASVAAGEAVDFAQAFADLPDEVSFSTGDVSVVAESGATLVTNFALFHDLNGTPVGIEADEVLFYNFNPTAIAERLRGNNLGETLTVADRIELRGVKSIGMEAVSELFLEQYIGAIDDLTPADDAVVDELKAMDMFSYNFGIEKMLIDGFTLHPFSYVAPIEDDIPATEPPLGSSDAADESLPEVYVDASGDRDAEARAGFQNLAAFARSFSIDAIAYESFSADYAMKVDDIEMSMDMNVGLAGLRGYNRGDLDFSGSWDAGFGGEMPIPDNPDDPDSMSVLPMVGGIKSSTVSGLQLGRVFEALANWEMPSRDETDILDLGIWTLSNYRLDMGGETVFNSDSIAFDSDFHWLLPTAIELTLSDTGYDLGSLLSVMTEQLGEDLDAEITPEQIRTGLEIADRYGFDCICGDYSLNIGWDEETGAINYLETGQFAEAFSGFTSFDIGFSTPAEIAALFDADDPESAFQMALVRDFEFRSLNWQMNDLGGLTNLFEMLHAIGEAFPDEEGMAMLAYNEPDQLRMLAVNSVIGMKPMVRQQVPGLDPWMDALAGFLEEGGSLKFGANPDDPVTAGMIAILGMGSEQPDPEQIIELFGLTVSHTK